MSIRGIVFVHEQNCPFSEEYDSYDCLDVAGVDHIIGKKDEQPVATGRIIYKENKVAKLERFAVLTQFRGKGVGKGLIEYMLATSLAKKCDTIYIHAQTRLLEYYERLGFFADGQVFVEANIEHKKMVYRLGGVLKN